MVIPNFLAFIGSYLLPSGNADTNSANECGSSNDFTSCTPRSIAIPVRSSPVVLNGSSAPIKLARSLEEARNVLEY